MAERTNAKQSRTRRLIAALALGAAALAAAPSLASATTITVDDDRTQCGVADYTTLQAAVQAASNFDTIHICPGTYSVPGGPAPSSGLRIEKNLTIRGAGASKVFIQPAQGTGSIAQPTPNPRDEFGNVITVRRRTVELTNVNLSGFTIRGGDVAVEAGLAVIDVVQSTISGIKVDGVSGDGVILANTIEATHNLASVEGIAVSGYGTTGIHVDNRLLNGAGSVGNGSVMDARISNASIAGSGGEAPAPQNGIAAFGAGSKLTLSKSKISGTGAPDGTAAAIELRGIDSAHSLIGGSAASANHLRDNVYGAWNGDAGTGPASSALAATNNYWTPAAATPPVSAQVSYTPVRATVPPDPVFGTVTDAPPTLAWDSPEDGSSVVADQTTSLDAVAGDDFGITSVSYSVDGDPLGAAATPPLGGGRVYSLDWSPSSEDIGETKTLTATATDEAGQTVSKSIAVEIVGAPFFGSPVAITGATQGHAGVGVQLTCLDGTPGGDPPPTATFQWFSGADPVGAGTSHYTPTAADQGKQLTCKVTLQSPGGTLSRTSDAVPVASPPAFVTGPTITSTSSSTGTGTLTCSAVASGGPVPGLIYAWLRDGVAIPNEDDPVLIYSVAADGGHTLTCRVRATNSAGQIEASVDAPATAAPTFAVPPAITGTVGGFAITGTALTCSHTPAGFPGPNAAYAWFNGAAQISGQTQATFTPGTTTQGAAISCRVTLTNAFGTANLTSAPVTVATNPAFSAAAAIAGADLPGFAFAGTELTCSATATGTPAPTVTYAWLRDGAEIDLATAPAYTVAPADIGHSLTCRATATALGNPATSVSPAIAAAAPPEFTGPPSITGLTAGYAITGQEATCEVAVSGTPAPTVTYEWLAGTDTVGSASTYTPVSGDQGKALTCEVTISSAAGGPLSQTSAPATVATPIGFSSAAAITGATASPLAVPGDVLSCAAIASGDPAPSVAYRWQLDGVDIPGEGDDSYTVTAADASHTIGCIATASVAVPAGMGESSATIVVGTPPSFGGTPEISGLIEGYAVAGTELTCSDGSPVGDPAPDVSFAFTADGAPVGSDAPTYTPVTDDEGVEITCTVTLVSAAGGPVDAASAAVPVATTPTVTDAEITGASAGGGALAIPGDELTCAADTTGDPTPSIAYTWFADDAPIEGATDPAYTVVAADAGAEITCLVSAVNVAGNAEDWDTLGSGGPPAGAKPTITGSAKVGSTLTCEKGAWTGIPDPEFTYAWKKGGAEIGGATGTTYAVPATDVGAEISCEVTGESDAGTMTRQSDPVTIAATPATGRPGAKVLKPRGANVSVGSVFCEAGPCTITVPAHVTVKIGKKKFRLAVSASPVELKSGESATIVVKLTKGARKALAKARRSKPATLEVSYSGGGTSGASAFTFVIKR